MVDAERAQRKFEITDFLEPVERGTREGHVRGEKVDVFRKQREFGARKRIKP